MFPPFISAKDLALRESAQNQAWPPWLFSPVFFVSFPLPSFSWPILSNTFYMNNYLLPTYAPFILAHPAWRHPKVRDSTPTQSLCRIP